MSYKINLSIGKTQERQLNRFHAHTYLRHGGFVMEIGKKNHTCGFNWNRRLIILQICELRTYPHKLSFHHNQSGSHYESFFHLWIVFNENFFVNFEISATESRTYPGCGWGGQQIIEDNFENQIFVSLNSCMLWS